MTAISINKFKGPSTVLFFIGLCSAFKFQLVGTIFVSDAILIFLLPFLAFRSGSRELLRLAAPLLLMLGLWLVGAILTDMIRQTAFSDYARGWSKIVFFAMAFTAVLLISGAKIDRLMSYFAGLAVAGIMSTALFPNAYQTSIPWKFGYATPIALLTVIFSSISNRSSTLRQLFPTFVMAAINLMMNFRSMFAMLIATTAIGALSAIAQALAPGRRLVSAGFAVAVIALGGAGVWGGSVVYGQFAESGMLGLAAKQKFEGQNQGGMGLLLGGRSEALVSTRAIADSPFIGHGSWPEDRYYVALQILLLREKGVQYTGENFSSLLIPAHSYLLGSWVEAGIAGGLFWIVILVLMFRSLFFLIDLRSPATPFAAFTLIQLLWNIPFSPFGADVRFFVAGQLCVIIWAFQQAKHSPTGRSAPRSM